MHTEAGLRFLALARIGSVRLGVTPAWPAGQAIGWAALSVIGYASVNCQLGISMTPLASLWLGLTLLAVLNLTVVVHEGGHALAAVIAGLPVRAVILVAYGGATIRDTNPRYDRLTAAAGPLANLAVATLAWLALSHAPGDSPLASLLLLTGMFQALSGLINLLPIARCDGARIFR